MSNLTLKKKCDTHVVALACGSGSPKNKPKKNGPWFNVVPVKVWSNNQNNYVMIYALLDSAAATRLCADSLVSKILEKEC